MKQKIPRILPITFHKPNFRRTNNERSIFLPWANSKYRLHNNLMSFHFPSKTTFWMKFFCFFVTVVYLIFPLWLTDRFRLRINNNYSCAGTNTFVSVLKTYIYILGLNAGTILFKRNNIEYGLQKTYYSFRGIFNNP